MVRLKGRNNRVIRDAELGSSHREATSNSQVNNQNEILEHLIHALVAM